MHRLAAPIALAAALLATPIVAAPAFATPEPASGLAAATAALQANDLASAWALFEAAGRADPAAPGPYLGRSDVLVRRRDLDGAEAVLRQGLAMAQPRGVLLRALGLLQALRNQPDAAIASYAAAIAAGEPAAALHIELGNLLSNKLDQPGRAIAHFDAALATAPGSAAAHFGKGVALLRTATLETGPTAAPSAVVSAARAELEAAQRLDATDPMAPLALAQLHANQGDLPAALAALDTSLARAPGLLPARIIRGDLLQAAGRSAAAIEDYETVLRRDPKALNALLGLGVALQQGGNAAAAQAAYRRAIEVAPETPLALNNLAMILSEEKLRLPEALILAKRAATLAPASADLRDTLGWVRHRSGDLAGAEADYRAALELQPTSGTHLHLGQVLAAAGRKAEAADSYRQALALEPRNLAAQDELRRLQ